MGILQLVQSANALAERHAARGTVAIRSPWTTTDLSKVVWSDIFGAEFQPVTRAEAMALPAVARGRHLLVSTIAQLPLATYRAAEKVSTPGWLTRTNGPTSPAHRMAWTVDDLIFSGWSLWVVERATGGGITDAARCPAERWHLEDDGTILVADDDGQDTEVDPASVILIPGFHEGLMTYGARTIRSARDLELTWSGRAKNPIPAVELHQTTDDELTDLEIDDLIAAYVRARQDVNGSVTYTPSSVELRIHGAGGTNDLLIEGRNAAAIDVARMLGLPAAMIDASNVNASLTYETMQGRSLEFRDYSLALYTGAIAARLSMDDVTPRGTRIGFDATELVAPAPTPSGPTTED